MARVTVGIRRTGYAMLAAIAFVCQAAAQPLELPPGTTLGVEIPAGSTQPYVVALPEGMAAAYQGDFSASVDAAERALALYGQTGDVRYQGIVLGNLSDVYTRMGMTDRALSAAYGALKAAEETSDGQGIAYHRMADYQESLKAYATAEAVSRWGLPGPTD